MPLKRNMVRRSEAPIYHSQFKNEVEKVSSLLMEASEITEDMGLKKYLSLRAEAFLNDEYQASDMAWLDMKDNTIGTYSVNFDAFGQSTNDLSALILTIQGNGDYSGVGKLLEEKGIIDRELQGDLDRLTNENIPVDVTFLQGPEILGI